MSETDRIWREVSASEAVAWSVGRVIAAGHDEEGGFVTDFTDGAAMRVWLDPGRVWSEWTEEPARLVIEVSDAARAATTEGGTTR